MTGPMYEDRDLLIEIRDLLRDRLPESPAPEGDETLYARRRREGRCEACGEPNAEIDRLYALMDEQREAYVDTMGSNALLRAEVERLGATPMAKELRDEELRNRHLRDDVERLTRERDEWLDKKVKERARAEKAEGRENGLREALEDLADYIRPQPSGIPALMAEVRRRVREALEKDALARDGSVS